MATYQRVNKSVSQTAESDDDTPREAYYAIGYAHVTLMGTLFNVPEVVRVKEGELCRFTLVRRSGEGLSFFRCVIWGSDTPKVLANFCDFVSPGNGVVVMGELRPSSYVKDGVTHNTMEIKVTSFQRSIPDRGMAEGEAARYAAKFPQHCQTKVAPRVVDPANMSDEELMAEMQRRIAAKAGDAAKAAAPTRRAPAPVVNEEDDDELMEETAPAAPLQGRGRAQ